MAISNNDCTVKFYDVPIRAQSQKRTIKEAGSLRLDVPINHSSISPDGRTLLSVGDSSNVYFHHISGGARLTFSPIKTLTIPAPDTSPYPSSSLAASFSTAFSSDGMKFAVASQEGVVAVWDVRSCKPLKVFQTDKTRVPSGCGGASGWLSDDPWEWTRGSSKAPGWSVRNVKFNTGNFGKEIMAFTEHTSLIHLVDARTFDTDEVIRVPTVPRRSPPPSASRPQQLRPVHPPPQQQQQQQQRHFFTNSTSSSRIGSPPSFLVSGPSSPRRPPTIAHRDLSIVQALGDAFRIPTSAYSAPSSISDSTWRTLSGLAHRSSASGGGGRGAGAGAGTGQSEQDLLLIPPLGDRDVESEVHALLEGHGGLLQQSATRHPGVVNDDEDIEDDFAEDEEDDRDTNTGSTHADYEYRIGGGARSRRNRNRTSRTTTRSGGGDSQPLQTQAQAQHLMEVDEVDGNSSAGECISRTPSRSSSPTPSSTLRERSVRRHTSSSLPLVSSSGDQAKGSYTGEMVYPSDDLDLAGVCFDPYGGRIYVASTEAVAEWGVRGADKCWWFGDGWR